MSTEAGTTVISHGTSESFVSSVESFFSSLFTSVETESHTEQVSHSTSALACPEIDPGSGMVAVTILIGALLVMRGARKARS